MNMVDDGISVDHPIEVIIHCFDRLPPLLSRLASRSKKPDVEDVEPEYEYTPIRTRRNYLSGEPTVQVDYEPTQYSEPTKRNAIEEKQYPSYEQILQTLYSADDECGIYLTLHFENPANIEKYSSYFCDSMSQPDIKDAIIAPTIPNADDTLSYKQIIDSLRAIKQHDFAELYSTRSDSAGVNSAEERNNFNYYILVDENVPFKFLPYEYDIDIGD